MNNDTRRLVIGMGVAVVVFIAYQYIVNTIYPPRLQPTPTTSAFEPNVPPAPGSAPATPAPQTSASPTTPAAGRTFSLVAAPTGGPVLLGGHDGDALEIELDQRGASLTALRLFAKDSKGRFLQTSKPRVNEPYQLLWPVEDGLQLRRSFATHQIYIDERDGQPWKQSWLLEELPWELAEDDAAHAVFRTAIRSADDGEALVRLRKTYTLRRGKPIFDLVLSVENASPASLSVRIEQDGPLGIREENRQYDMRRLLAAQRPGSTVELTAAKQYAELQKATRNAPQGFVQLLKPDQGPLLWTALANKYFAVYTRPLPQTGDVQDYVAAANGLVAVPNAPTPAGDLLARLVTKPALLAPGNAARYPFEIYAGPKDAELIRAVEPDYVDISKLHYHLARSADTTCFCTFLWLEELMLWLLDKIHLVVRNYGVGIMILVVIIRTLLHPLSRFQQKSMFRMQEGMARVQPRMQEIKQKYANDKVKQNQESMKLFAEEGVNPAGSFVSFLPMFLQMPILVALWTALNTDIHLRHAPFDGWWIFDLSAPDSFLTFNPPITVPILGDLPLIGGVFSGITALNVLPILMGVSMWLQQKYMPKPQVKAKPDAAKHHDPSKPRSGMSPEDQIRQQVIMSYMMAILFPLMFYNMPSGLNLYWLSTNVFGIFESLIIRKQIAEEKARREREGPRPPSVRKPGLVGRIFKHLAAGAEELQHKADALAKNPDVGKRDKKKSS